MTYTGNDGPWRDGLTEEVWKDRWPNFTPEEMTCRGSGELKIIPDFMDRLQAVRTAFGKPMVVTSGYRSPEYNAQVSGTGTTGPHTTGRAVDVQVSGTDAHRLVQLALDHGFTGVGVKQKGPHGSRFIHLDDIEPGGKHPRPWVWSY